MQHKEEVFNLTDVKLSVGVSELILRMIGGINLKKATINLSIQI